jgi:hypothetical protein
VTAPAVSLRTALADPSLLGNVLVGESFSLWKTVLLATNGEPLTEAERADFDRVSGLKPPPISRVDEALFLIGRRGGKDTAVAPFAVYLAACVDWSAVLAPGERGIGLVIAPDQRQARIQFDYISAVFDSSPILSALVVNRTADTIELVTGISIQVRAANFRHLRGATLIFVLGTEAAFWYDESGANSDADILAAVRPGLATTGGPLILFTTPHARSGEVWKMTEAHYGAKGDPSILVVRGTSRDFNPTLSERVVARALARDPEGARAEYLAEFRSDVSALLAEASLVAVVPVGVAEIEPRHAVKGDSYFAHFDAATGSGGDSAALAIACSGKPAELVAVRRWRPPFSPRRVVKEAASLAASYGLAQVSIDRFAPGLVAELFREHEVGCEVSELTTSEAFIQLLALMNSQMVALLDVPELLGELRRLERRPGGAGRESVSHPPGGHDDVAAAVAQALAAAAARPSGPQVRVLRTRSKSELERSSRGGLAAARARADAQTIAAYSSPRIRF